VKVNDPVLELVPDVIPAIAWPNWLATCVIDRTKVSDALSECLSVAITLMASAFVPSSMRPLKVSVAARNSTKTAAARRRVTL
jgi:hypothetical protein